MQQIHVKRYEDPKAVHYQGLVEPEDRSWTLFIDKDGAPSLFVRVSMSPEEGKVEHGLINVRDLPRDQEIIDGFLSPVTP